MKRVSILKIIIFSMLVFCLGSSALAQEWYNSAWSRRQKITIDSDNAAFGLSGNLTEFPYLIKITDGGNDLFSYAQSSGDDILFTASDGTTKLAHEIEAYNGLDDLTAWVRLPTFYSGADTIIYMYYGNSNAANQEQPQEVWANGYAGVWHLKEDGSVSDYEDSTNNMNVGVGGSVTSNESPTRSTNAIVGYSQDFDGIDDKIDVGDASNTSLNFGTQSFTFGLWVNSVVTSNYQWFLWRGAHSGGVPGYSIYRRDSANGGTYTINVGDTVDREKVTFTIADNTWYYLVGVVDRTTQELRGYVNGVLEGTPLDISYMGSVDYFADNFRFGRNSDIDGLLDEARVSNVPRSADWIKTQYNMQLPAHQGAPTNISGKPNTIDNNLFIKQRGRQQDYYQYRKLLTINRNKVEGTHTDFPVLTIAVPGNFLPGSKSRP
ncbi:MAG: hypothetical protein AMS17_16230 [Spirochaetes bacterium DG_61]|nr:MAG: hypothetical protein AMS17_16230 [Spirochaetes bacterium DG_61]